MSKLFKITFSAVLSTAVLLTPVASLAAVPDYSSNTSLLVDYLKSNQATDGSISGFGGETAWVVMGFVANGIDPNTVEIGGVSVIDFLKNNPPATVSAWERDLLAITAAGENPFTFGGHNYVAQVQSSATSGQIGSATSINDDTFGILSLISAGPSANQSIISDSVDFVIANQNSDGGWSYAVGNPSDPDSTAIAVLALQSAQSRGFSNTGLNNAISDGADYLTGSQQSDGGWDAGFGTNAGSTAWSVLALLGDDSAVTDGLNFIVGKQDVTGGIDGGFGADTYTSANSLIAFGQTAFPIGSFDGTFVEPENPDQEQPVTPPTNPDQGNPPGQVLASTTSADQNGQVLAALPDTGIASQLTTEPVSVDIIGQTKVNLVLITSLSVLLAGLVLWLVSGRIRKSIVD